MPISSHNRFFSFDSPLGPDKLLVNAFAGSEKISELFSFDLELVSEDFSIDWDTIVDRNVTVGIRMSDGQTFRYFNGYINAFEPIKHEGRLAYYKATLVPWLWYLTQTSDHLIYQKMTIVDVIKATFDKYAFRDYDVKSLGDRHAKWITCCQYQENAFDFVSRLAEAEGVYYYFKHERGKHTLMMVDHVSAHQPCPYQSSFRYEHQVGDGQAREDDTVFNCNMRKIIKPNKYAHKDFNFLIPSHELYFEAPMKNFMGSQRQLKWYDYPGEYEWQEDAPDWGDLRQEEHEHDRTWIEGGGNARALIPGYRFDLTQHDRNEQNINYLVVSVTHNAHEGGWGAGMDSGESDYSNTFTAIPSSVQYRPGRKTERPQIASLQTGIVVGPAGEEIYTDEYGRVKVHFHWDRKKPNENSSAWIRVMQPIAGPGYGHVWIPRVGQEVIIQFVDGDPDRPVITGCLYNHKNHPPYPLPGNKNWSGIKTRSTKKGDEKEYNELRFVDTKGEELFVIHAQKDLQISVENDETSSIERDLTLKIKRNQVEEVDGDKNLTVKGSLNQDIQTSKSLNVKNDINEKAGGNIIIQAGGDLHFKAGGRIVFEAADGVTWFGTGASGQNFIDINHTGVIIQGQQVLINCGIAPPPGAQAANPTPPQVPNLAAPDTSGFANTPNLVTGQGPAPAGGNESDDSALSTGSSGSSGSGPGPSSPSSTGSSPGGQSVSGGSGPAPDLSSNPWVAPSSQSSSTLSGGPSSDLDDAAEDLEGVG